MVASRTLYLALTILLFTFTYGSLAGSEPGGMLRRRAVTLPKPDPYNPDSTFNPNLDPEDHMSLYTYHFAQAQHYDRSNPDLARKYRARAEKHHFHSTYQSRVFEMMNTKLSSAGAKTRQQLLLPFSDRFVYVLKDGTIVEQGFRYDLEAEQQYGYEWEEGVSEFTEMVRKTGGFLSPLDPSPPDEQVHELLDTDADDEKEPIFNLTISDVHQTSCTYFSRCGIEGIEERCRRD